MIFALRGAAAYEAFAKALSDGEPAPSRPAAPAGPAVGGPWPRRRPPEATDPHRPTGRRVSLPYQPLDQRREALVELVAREIRLRGLTGPAVHFLEASRPYRPLGAPAMLFFDPVLGSCSAATRRPRREFLCDDAGIEALIDRLEELDEVDGWDA